jgi:hypothetical protein
MHLHGSAKPIHKLDARAKKVHLISYIGNHIYRVWDPDSNTVHVTSNVTFNKHIRPPVQLSQTKEISGSTDTPYQQPLVPTVMAMQPLDDAIQQIDNTLEDYVHQNEPLFRPVKGFAMIKSISSDLPAP